MKTALAYFLVSQNSVSVRASVRPNTNEHLFANGFGEDQNSNMALAAPAHADMARQRFLSMLHVQCSIRIIKCRRGPTRKAPQTKNANASFPKLSQIKFKYGGTGRYAPPQYASTADWVLV